MHCSGCNREDAWNVRTIVDKGEFVSSCNFCGGYRPAGLEYSDVYFPGPHSCQNITDDNGKPVFFETRSQKAQYMREKGIQEAGDRIRGSYAMPRPSGRTWYEQRRSQGKLK